MDVGEERRRSKMIVGDGDIASVIPDRADRTYFASGVSNSKEAREYQYKMEMDLLLSQNKDKKLIYFSSLSIFYANNRYTQHKLFMERLIKNHFDRYCIFRLGNITWGSNPNTIINYLRSHKRAKLQDTDRYLIDKEEFVHWINHIPEFNCEMNLTGHKMTVKEIYKKYVE